MPLTRLQLKNFTVFEELDFRPNPGLNILVGANGTGKTHLMKVAYAACDVSITEEDLDDKIVSLFLPSGRRLGRLVRRRQGVENCSIAVWNGRTRLQVRFTSRRSDYIRSSSYEGWRSKKMPSAYIPVKEMLANAPGFVSLYDRREIHFEEIYRDILTRAYVPIERGPIPRDRSQLLKILNKAMGGTVTSKNEEFFLRSRAGNLEFTLLAEGLRKLGLLWLLIRNGTLLEGSVLFWDEPETNLNPTLYGPVVEILLALQRLGVQIFVATHDYSILKHVELGRSDDDDVQFHALAHVEDGSGVELRSFDDMPSIDPNLILSAFDELHNWEVDRTLERLQSE